MIAQLPYQCDNSVTLNGLFSSKIARLIVSGQCGCKDFYKDLAKGMLFEILSGFLRNLNRRPVKGRGLKIWTKTKK